MQQNPDDGRPHTPLVLYANLHSMKVAVILCFYLMLCAPQNSCAQWPNAEPGMQQYAMAQTALNTGERWQAWYNPARLALADGSAWRISASFQKPFFAHPLDQQSLGMEKQWKRQGAGGGLILQQLPGMQHWNIYGGYGRQLHKRVALGLRMLWRSGEVPSENWRFFEFRMALFGSYQWTSHLLFSFGLEGLHYSEEEFLPAAPTLKWGVGWDISPQQRLGLENSLQGVLGNRWQLGYQWRLSERMQLMAGLAALPLQLSWGFGYQWGPLECTFAGAWSPTLPAGIGMEWSYEPQ